MMSAMYARVTDVDVHRHVFYQMPMKLSPISCVVSICIVDIMNPCMKMS